MGGEGLALGPRLLHQISEKKENFWSSPVYWANDFLDKNPFFVNDEAFWNSGYPVERFDSFVRIQEYRESQIYFSHKMVHRFSPIRVNADCQYFQVLTSEFFIKPLHGGHFLPARRAPGGPYVDQNHFTPVVKKSNSLTIEIGEGKVGRFKSRLNRSCGCYGRISLLNEENYEKYSDYENNEYGQQS